MLAWVLNTLVLSGDSSKVLHYKTLEIYYFLKVLYFFSFIKPSVKHLTIKSFDLLNSIPLSRTKALVNQPAKINGKCICESRN